LNKRENERERATEAVRQGMKEREREREIERERDGIDGIEAAKYAMTASGKWQTGILIILYPRTQLPTAHVS
jgi:hypothetical protein